MSRLIGVGGKPERIVREIVEIQPACSSDCIRRGGGRRYRLHAQVGFGRRQVGSAARRFGCLAGGLTSRRTEHAGERHGKRGYVGAARKVVQAPSWGEVRRLLPSKTAPSTNDAGQNQPRASECAGPSDLFGVCLRMERPSEARRAQARAVGRGKASGLSCPARSLVRDAELGPDEPVTRACGHMANLLLWTIQVQGIECQA
jgi:hypothetical protein